MLWLGMVVVVLTCNSVVCGVCVRVVACCTSYHSDK